MLSWLVEPERWEDVPFLEAKHEELRRDVLDLPLTDADGERLSGISPRTLDQSAGFHERIYAIATARREAQEEAGLQLGRLEQIGRYYSSPGTVAEYLCAFVGEADLSEGGGLHGLISEDEDIRAIVVGRGEAMAAVASGEINNAHTILPLLYLELHHRRLRELWSEPGPPSG